MHDLPGPSRVTLDPTQQLRRESAARALATSRITDLATLDATDSILLIEKLRAALDDTLILLDECSN